MAPQPRAESFAGSDLAPEPARAQPTRSRRSILGAGLAGLAGLVLGSLGRPLPAEAAVTANPLLLGVGNDAGTGNTTLTTASSGTALHVTQTGTGTALRGVADNGIAGFFTSVNGSGVSGVVANNTKYGVYGGNDAASYGGGAAMRANGEHNHGVVATTADLAAIAVKATNSAVGTSTVQGPAVLALASGGAAADIQAMGYFRAAGEFSGPNGVIGAASTETDDGFGVIGVAGGATGKGIVGRAWNATGTTYGVEGDVDSSAGIGVFGHASNATGGTIGVQGKADSSGGAGVLGQAPSSTGETFGVAAFSGSPAGYGLYAENTASTGTAFGAHIRSTGGSPEGVGLEGDGPYIGVFGFASATSGTTYAVYGGVVSASGYAIYGEGKGAVTGNFSKAGGSFKIDHPVDPANKYLLHSFVESPDMMNVYNGIATLDAAGEATVTLPDWFDALNRDFRYQLTPIGGAAPDLHVKSEVKGNGFSIGGGRAGQRVSWQLTGIRQDAWANAHRIEVEEAKPAGEKGLYLHPLEHGRSESEGIKAPRPAAPTRPTLAPASQSGQPNK